jgi:phenylacetic acid degradation operon negative regulatory protein
VADLGSGACAAVPEAFATYIRCIDSWRTIPYLDPGLPSDCLPGDWPGRASSELFLGLRDAYAAPAAQFVHSVLRD